MQIPLKINFEDSIKKFQQILLQMLFLQENKLHEFNHPMEKL